MTRAFVIRPFDKKKDSSGTELDFEWIHNELIGPALDAAKLSGATTGEIIDSGNIRDDMFSLILEADIVICDVSIHNANVFYELGIRHALRKSGTILIKAIPSADNIPFDLLTDRYLPYQAAAPAGARDKLVAMIGATLLTQRETDSPIFKMLPGLAEADPSKVQTVPLDLREEVDRARAAKSRGWLRLLAGEVRGQRFQWPALQLIAEAQWKLKDYDGARESFEAIRNLDRYVGSANLALASVYERLYQREKRVELLQISDQAIERALTCRDVTPKGRAEALALKGRNHKSRWRRDLEGLGSVEERRRSGVNAGLLKSYQAYREAFDHDLNHFYPGLTALQMAKIFLDLAEDPSGSWMMAFDSEDEAGDFRRRMIKEAEVLRLLVSAAIEARLRQLSETDPERTWAEISRADILFLFEAAEGRIVRRYQDVIPKNDPFAWDAAKGQLSLYALLGIRPDIATKVITEVDNLLGERKEDEPPHLLLFAGHRIDGPGHPPRFPEHRQDRAKELIRQEIEKLGKRRMVALASAAPGADILFLEVCAELGIEARLCLPMRDEIYSKLAYKDLDKWRSRFLDLRGKVKEILELSDTEGLPRWLQGGSVNPWERGNRWVVQMALAAEAGDVTLIALWDGKEEGEAPGGTAHMVNLVRDAGTIRVHLISTESLLAESS